MGSAGYDPAEIIDETLAVTDHEERVRRLRRRQDAFAPALVEEFRSLARDELRRDPTEAGSRARLARVVAEFLEDETAILACVREQAQADLLRGAHAEALDALDGAAALSVVRDDDLRRADIDAMRVQALVPLDRHEEAEEIGQRALETFERRGKSGAAIRVRMALADQAYRLDRPREALRHHARIEESLTTDAPRSLRGVLAGNRANALEACNRIRAASRQFVLARDHFASDGSDHAVAQVDYNAAYAEMLRGRYTESLRRYAEAEIAFGELGDERHLAHVALDRAEIHLHLNLPEEVREQAAKAESVFRDLGLEKEAAEAVHLAGRAAEIEGDREQADRLLRQAGRAFGRLGLDERRFSCLVQRAGMAESAGETAAAESLVARARAMVECALNPVSVAALDLVRSRVDLARGRLDRARARAERIAIGCRRIHAPWIQIEAHRILGRLHRCAGRPAEAILAYRTAIEHLDHYRGGVPPDEYMAAFLAGRTELYVEIVDLLVEQGEDVTAFEFAERAKSRALTELLAEERRSSGRRQGSAAETRLRYLRERLSALYQRLFRMENDERGVRAAERLRREAGRLEKQIARRLRQLRLGERTDERSDPDAVEAPDLASVRAALPEGTALLEYFLTARHLITFHVTRDHVRVVRQDVGEEELASRVERFRFHLDEQRADVPDVGDITLRATRANLAELSTILLDPVAVDLEVDRLVVVPHGVLHQLPFHALPRGDGWLTDRYEIVYAPSAAVYMHCGERRPEASGLPAVFGLPDEVAPRIEEESHRVAERLDSDRLFLHEEATFARLAEAARDARVVHIATHGMFRPAQPMLSAIRLADGWMNLYDLYELDIRGELVVLATCDSGTASVGGGDEILGLSRAFLYAGAPALLSSQWQVNDGATSELMDAFYRNLGAGRDAAAAQREAMREVRERHPHPYYWAPFFLTGRPVAARVATGTGRQPFTGRSRSVASMETTAP